MSVVPRNAYSITPLSHELISSHAPLIHLVSIIRFNRLSILVYKESTYDFVIVGLPGPVSQA